MFHDDNDATFSSPNRTSYVVLQDNQGGDFQIEEINTSHSVPQHSFSEKVLTQRASSLDDDSDNAFTPLLFTEEPTVLNGLNGLNVLTFILHCFVGWGIGSWGLDGVLPTTGQIVTQYETLVTPDRWAYYMWVPILLLEAVFVVSQLLPEYRSRPIVQDGTSFLFFYTCLIQTGWTLFLCFRFMILSFVAVALAWITLATLLTRQHVQLVRGRQSSLEYWLFRFPFYVHFAWISVMVVVHFSLLVRHYDSSFDTQLAADMVALSVLMPVACHFFLQQEANFVIPVVIVWSYFGIWSRLRHPSEELIRDYGEAVVGAAHQASLMLACILCTLIGPKLVIWACQTFFTISVVQLRLEDSYTAGERSGLPTGTPFA
jgi:hypothetical protein